MVTGEAESTFTVLYSDIVSASRDGFIRFPWGESISPNAESVLNHMFSAKPLQTLATHYAIRTFRSSGTGFGDTFVYESSRAPNGSRTYPFFCVVHVDTQLTTQSTMPFSLDVSRHGTLLSSPTRSTRGPTVYSCLLTRSTTPPFTPNSLDAIIRIRSHFHGIIPCQPPDPLLNTWIVRVEGQPFTLSPPLLMNLLEMLFTTRRGLAWFRYTRRPGQRFYGARRIWAVKNHRIRIRYNRHAASNFLI